MSTHIFARVSVLGVNPKGSQTLGVQTVDSAPGKPGKASFSLDFGDPRHERLTALEVSFDGVRLPGDYLRIRVVTIATVASPDDTLVSVRRERQAEVMDGGSFLHQAYEDAEHRRSVLITLTPEAREVPEKAVPSAGAPMSFHISLSRTTKAGLVPLEENVLRTLEGSPVSYAFSLAPRPPAPREDPTIADPGAENAMAPTPQPGEGGGVGSGTACAQELELSLLPRKASDGIVVVEASLRGRLRGGEGASVERAVLVNRTQALMRGGSFEFSVDDSASCGGGYKFVIRADF